MKIFPGHLDEASAYSPRSDIRPLGPTVGTERNTRWGVSVANTVSHKARLLLALVATFTRQMVDN